MIAAMVYIVAASGQNRYGFQTGYGYGSFITHRSLRKVPEAYQSSFSFDFYKLTDGSKYWQYDHNFPQMGLSLCVRDLGNRPVYGYSITLLPYLEFNIVKRAWGAIQIKHGTGLAWVTKTYDPVGNPENHLISTPLNATSILDAGVRVNLSHSLDVKVGGLVQHLSNGAFKFPNAGTNSGTIYGSLSWCPEGREVELKTFEKVRNYKQWRYRVGTSVGFYEYDAERNRVFLNLQGQVMVMRQHNTWLRSCLGLEGGHLFKPENQLAIYFEEEVQFGKITTRYGLGAYVLNKRVPGEDFYTKIGLAYYPFLDGYIPHKFYIGSMLKAHTTKAAHIELLAGYVF